MRTRSSLTTRLSPQVADSIPRRIDNQIEGRADLVRGRAVRLDGNGRNFSGAVRFVKPGPLRECCEEDEQRQRVKACLPVACPR